MNADSTGSPADFRALSEREQFALELRWYQEGMLPYVDWIMEFVERRRDEILESAQGAHEPDVWLAVTKRLIAERGTMHMAAEMKDQMKEIERELWLRGEKGEHDRAGIKLEWTKLHGAAWRRWRVQEYLFVADRCADRIVAVLETPGEGQPEAVAQ
jgi:hypothetical protein